MRIGDSVGFLTVGIDDSLIFRTGFEETQVEVDIAGFFGIYTTGIPVLAVLIFARNDDEFARLGVDILALGPVERHILDKLECVHALVIILGSVGCHLKGRIHGHVESELIGDCSLLVGSVAGRCLVEIHLEDTGGEVHRAAEQTGEGQDSAVAHRHILIFLTQSGLVCHEVGICAGPAGRADCLVGVNHDMVVGGALDSVEIVAHGALVVVIAAFGQDIAYIAALDCVVAILVHKLVGRVDMAFVVIDGAGCLMVHHKLNAFAVGIVVERFDVEVGIWSCEVEHIFLFFSEPVFPSYVPALYKQLIHTIVSGEIDIFAHGLVVGEMTSVGFGLRVIKGCKIEIFGVGVRPRGAACDHFPPDTHKFGGMNP